MSFQWFSQSSTRNDFRSGVWAEAVIGRRTFELWLLIPRSGKRNSICFTPSPAVSIHGLVNVARDRELRGGEGRMEKPMILSPVKGINTNEDSGQLISEASFPPHNCDRRKATTFGNIHHWSSADGLVFSSVTSGSCNPDLIHFDIVQTIRTDSRPGMMEEYYCVAKSRFGWGWLKRLPLFRHFTSFHTPDGIVRRVDYMGCTLSCPAKWKTWRVQNQLWFHLNIHDNTEWKAKHEFIIGHGMAHCFTRRVYTRVTFP
jgi:hypothetical protein